MMMAEGGVGGKSTANCIYSIHSVGDEKLSSPPVVALKEKKRITFSDLLYFWELFHDPSPTASF